MSRRTYYDELMVFDDRKKSYTLNFKTMKKACKMLNDDELGAVMRQVFEYAYSRVPTDEFPDQYERSEVMLVMYDLFVDDEIAYYDSYESRCRKNSENQKKRWENQKAAQSNQTASSENSESETVTSDTNVYERIRTYTNDTDKDKDKDKDKDTDKDTDAKKGRLTDWESELHQYAEELSRTVNPDAPMYCKRFKELHPRAFKNWRIEFERFIES